MTTLTGNIPKTLVGTVDPPTAGKALAGAVIQIASLTCIWFTCTSAEKCVQGPRQCWNDPWARQVVVTLAVCLVLWLYSLRTIPAKGFSDPSIVDRLWSVLPMLYCWHWYLSVPNARQLLMAGLTTVWGGRLTYNFAIKGGFSGGEDHRWKEVRSWPGFNRFWELFNFLFICGFQQLVILAFTSPAAYNVRADAPPLNRIDAAAALLYLLLVVGEAVADRQMYIFQTEKFRRIDAKEPLGSEYAHGFIMTGLWAYSRHPNYFCEVSLWWVFYLFSIAAGAPLLNWTMAGAFFLSLLFLLPQASLDVTENLSSRKYPLYAEYQARVSRFFPLPPRPAGEALPPMQSRDAALIVWFVLGTLITYLIDFEQVLIEDHSAYGKNGAPLPLWPPEPFVRAIHWWGKTADPLVLARPIWFKVAIWIEVLVQAPFYMLAMYAFARQRNWIRVPAIVYATVLLTIMPIVLAEQYLGPHATSQPWLVTAVYGAYVLMPLLVLGRVWSPQVFPPPLTPAKAHADAAPIGASRRRARSPGKKNGA